MIIGDLDIIGVALAPEEAYPKLTVDADCMLPCKIEGGIRFQIGKTPPWRLEAFWRASASQTAQDASDHPFVDPRALPGPAMGIAALYLYRFGNIG
jgi:hypothetical protein